MKKRLPAQGFTLVELVIVIVILSVLTATVLPRFVNLEEKATEAVLKSALTSVKSAARIGNLYSRTEAADAQGDVDIDGVEVYMQNDYPVARSNDIRDNSAPGAFAGIVELMEVDPGVSISYSDSSNTVDRNTAETTKLILHTGGKCVSYEAPAAAGDDPTYFGVGTYDAANQDCI